VDNCGQTPVDKPMPRQPGTVAATPPGGRLGGGGCCGTPHPSLTTLPKKIFILSMASTCLKLQFPINKETLMDTTFLKRVRTLYPQSRHLQRQWIKSIRHLGAKWLICQPQPQDKLREQAAGRWA